MTTLTERYVWGVLRAVPQRQRAELEPEIRALVADAVDAHAADGTPPEAAERAALTELGDPDALAARYTDRTLHLIGPRFFPEWRRLLGLLLPIVVPLAVIVTTAASALGGRPAGELVGVAISAGINVAIQLVFWVTLVFALLERSGQAPLGEAWTPDRLPEVPADAVRPNVAEVVLSIVALIAAAGALVWQQAAMPITIDGGTFPLFDPALWSFWIPWFLVLFVLEIGFTFVRWQRGGWTWTLAVVNLGLNLAFAIPAAWLAQEARLLDPGLVAAIDAKVGSAWLQPTLTIAVVVAVSIAAWDAVDGFRQARIRARG